MKSSIPEVGWGTDWRHYLKLQGLLVPTLPPVAWLKSNVRPCKRRCLMNRIY